jgi:hypothetical protein
VADAHLFELRAVGAAPALAARLRTPGSGPRAAVRFSYDGEVDQLLDGGYARRFGA